MNSSFLPNNPDEDLEQVENKIIEKSRFLVTQAIKKRGHEKPPFLFEEFAQLVGVNKILKEDIGELGGILLRYSDGYIIKLNRNHSVARQNFSFFHEVGHILLSELKLESSIASIEFRTKIFNPQMVDRHRSKAIERLCDVAASELLMPENVFRTYLSASDISINSLERLAGIFNTSIQTTAIRIAETSPTPCIAMLWKPQQAEHSEKLLLSWHMGPGRKPSSKDRYFPLKYIATTSSSVYKTYQRDDVVKCYRTFKTNTGNQRFPMESKAYGYGKERYVISLVLLSI